MTDRAQRPGPFVGVYDESLNFLICSSASSKCVMIRMDTFYHLNVHGPMYQIIHSSSISFYAATGAENISDKRKRVV